MERLDRGLVVAERAVGPGVDAAGAAGGIGEVVEGWVGLAALGAECEAWWGGGRINELGRFGVAHCSTRVSPEDFLSC